MAFSFHMIYNIDRRSVCGVISCRNKIGFAATNIKNIVFIHECYLCLLLMMKWRRKIIECALSSRKVDPPITTFLIFVANALTYQNHTHNSLCENSKNGPYPLLVKQTDTSRHKSITPSKPKNKNDGG